MLISSLKYLQHPHFNFSDVKEFEKKQCLYISQIKSLLRLVLFTVLNVIAFIETRIR